MTNTDHMEPLTILSELFQQLNAAGIRYCFWKSTHGLDDALRGEGDLDLLVDRMDATRLRAMILDRDFKPFVSAPQRQFPAVEDYLGFDRRAGRIVHLHLHYRVIIGGHYTKNYVLPLEASFLNNTRIRSGVRVPAPELETIVLVLRALLKYRNRDGLGDLLKLRRRGGLPPSILKEFDGLLAQTDLDRIASALKCHAAFIPQDLVFDFLKTVRKSPRDLWTLFGLRSHVRRVLAPYQRVGALRAEIEYYRIMLAHTLPSKRLRNYFLSDPHKKPATGGLGIAFIGTDGAGKSTSVQQIAKWLSGRLNVYKLYMGTTHPSLGTKALRIIATAGRAVQAGCGRVLGKANPVTRAARGLEQLLTDLRYLSEGRDRQNRYITGQRKIAQGGIVIYDRYPLAAVSIDGRAMDGPRIEANGGNRGGMFAKLAFVEENIYRGIRPPDHIVVLRVSPEVSLTRKPEHRRERIETKSQALAEFAREGLNVTEIDAEQPLDQVLLQIKSAIWSWM